MRVDAFWKILTLMLLVANCLLIYLLFQDKGGNRGLPDMPPHGGMKSVVSDVLGFDEQQNKDYRREAHLHHLKMMELSREQSQVLREYFQQLNGLDADSPSQVLVEKYHEIEAEKLTVTYRHFLDIKKLCNDDQLEYFDDILEDLLKIVSTSGGERPPHPPHHPPF